MTKTDDIQHALRLLNAAFAQGAIGANEYERQDARLRARQAAIRAWQEGQGRGGPVSRPVSGFTAPAALEVRATTSWPPAASVGLPRLPFLRRPIRADLPVRVERRRGLAYGGMLPPATAKAFTVGEAAVLAVLAWEQLNHGACRKSYAEVADEAGCSRQWVKQTVRKARLLGLLTVEHRPRPGRKDDTNVVRIVAVDWLGWLKVRRARQKTGRRAASIGVSRLSPPPNISTDKNNYVAEKPMFRNEITTTLVDASRNRR